MKLVNRFVATVIVSCVYGVLQFLLRNAGDVAAAQAAPMQLSNNNVWFIVSRGIAARGWLDISVALLAVIALVIIWLPVLIKLSKREKVGK